MTLQEKSAYIALYFYTESEKTYGGMFLNKIFPSKISGNLTRLSLTYQQHWHTSAALSCAALPQGPISYVCLSSHQISAYSSKSHSSDPTALLVFSA